MLCFDAENAQEIKHINEEAFSSRTTVFPNGSQTRDLPEYQLDALATELRGTHGEQSRKLGSYV